MKKEMENAKILVSIRDAKAGYYYPPRPVRSLGEALRDFTSLVNDKNTVLGQHPHDFALFEVGRWDERTCCFALLASPQHRASGHELVDGLHSPLRAVDDGEKGGEAVAK